MALEVNTLPLIVTLIAGEPKTILMKVISDTSFKISLLTDSLNAWKLQELA